MNDVPERAARLVQLLNSTDVSNQTKVLEEITDIRERIEVVHTSIFNSFLEHLFPVFEQLLNSLVPPGYRLQDVNNRIRFQTLEILIRLPINETLRPYASRLVDTNLNVVFKDNEVNSLLSMRILFEAVRAFHVQLIDSGMPRFLQLVTHLYSEFEATVNLGFSYQSIQTGQEKPKKESDLSPHSNPSSSAATPGTTPVSELDESSIVLLRGVNSFRVMVECPMIVMLILQLHPPFIPDLDNLLTVMLNALSVRIPSEVLKCTFSDREKRCKQFRFESFVACDVKTLSFLV